MKNTDATHCIVCEDDIKISKHLAEDLPQILDIFKTHKLDVLLLGFLFPYEILPDQNHHFSRITRTDKYQFLRFPDDLWGSQMYLMSREHAHKMVTQYPPDYIIKQDGNSKTPYNPDWILTKQGNRALIYPMLAVEEGDSPMGNQGHANYHQLCYLRNYVEGIHQ